MSLSPHSWYDAPRPRGVGAPFGAFAAFASVPPVDPATAREIVYPVFGRVVGRKTDIKFYDLSRVPASRARALAKRRGFQVAFFGNAFGPPDFKTRNFDTGWLMIFDPTDPHGSFRDPDYTEAWRVLHELAHALTQKRLDAAYGWGRRGGRLGAPLTLRECQRAVTWEHLTVTEQHGLSKLVGARISQADLARERNVILADAVIRAVTGDFSDPDLDGLEPSTEPIPIARVLDLLAGFAECRRGAAA